LKASIGRRPVEAYKEGGRGTDLVTLSGNVRGEENVCCLHDGSRNLKVVFVRGGGESTGLGAGVVRDRKPGGVQRLNS